MDIERLKEREILLDYEIEDKVLKSYINEVLTRIHPSYIRYFPFFNIYSGSSVEAADVYEDSITFDIAKLYKSSEGIKEVIIGVIAHEIAHVYKKHSSKASQKDALRFEDEADQLASEWGFEQEIQLFREKLGHATDLRQA